VAPGGDKQKSRRALIEHRTDDDLEVELRAFFEFRHGGDVRGVGERDDQHRAMTLYGNDEQAGADVVRNERRKLV
jgi:hypothetical protein